MVKYKYERPEGVLYKVSTRKFNKVFSCTRASGILSYFAVTEMYVSEDKIVCHHLLGVVGKILFMLMLPPVLLYATISVGFKEAVNECQDIIFMKKRGRFGSDVIYKRDEKSWNKVKIELLKYKDGGVLNESHNER